MEAAHPEFAMTPETNISYGGRVAESAHVFVLTSLAIDSDGAVISKNVGVTFSLHEAEAHRAQGVEHNFEMFQIDSNWQEDAATSDLVIAMRAFRDYVDELRAEALR